MNVWNIKQTEEFQDWFEEADDQLQEDIVENVEILRQFGPNLGRPKADTIKGSTIRNLKELRFDSDNKVVRLFFVFDPDRNAVLLVGGDKAGSGDKTFYTKMIAESEKVYVKYLEERKRLIQEEEDRLKKAKKKKTSKKTKKGRQK